MIINRPSHSLDRTKSASQHTYSLGYPQGSHQSSNPKEKSNPTLNKNFSFCVQEVCPQKSLDILNPLNHEERNKDPQKAYEERKREIESKFKEIIQQSTPTNRSTSNFPNEHDISKMNDSKDRRKPTDNSQTSNRTLNQTDFQGAEISTLRGNPDGGISSDDALELKSFLRAKTNKANNPKSKQEVLDNLLKSNRSASFSKNGIDTISSQQTLQEKEANKQAAIKLLYSGGRPSSPQSISIPQNLSTPTSKQAFDSKKFLSENKARLDMLLKRSTTAKSPTTRANKQKITAASIPTKVLLAANKTIDLQNVGLEKAFYPFDKMQKEQSPSNRDLTRTKSSTPAKTPSHKADKTPTSSANFTRIIDTYSKKETPSPRSSSFYVIRSAAVSPSNFKYSHKREASVDSTIRENVTEKLDSTSKEALNKARKDNERLTKPLSVKRIKYYCYCEQRYKVEEVKKGSEEATPVVQSKCDCKDSLKKRVQKKMPDPEPEPIVEPLPPKFSELSFETRGVLWEHMKRANRTVIEEELMQKKYCECTFSPRTNERSPSREEVMMNLDGVYLRQREWQAEVNSRRQSRQEERFTAARKPLRFTHRIRSASCIVYQDGRCFSPSIRQSPHGENSRSVQKDLFGKATGLRNNQELLEKNSQPQECEESPIIREIISARKTFEKLGEIIKSQEKSQSEKKTLQDSKTQQFGSESFVNTGSKRPTVQRLSLSPERSYQHEFYYPAKKAQPYFDNNSKSKNQDKLAVVVQPMLSISKKINESQSKTRQEESARQSASISKSFNMSMSVSQP